MHSYSVEGNHPGRVGHNTSDPEGHISLRFRPALGSESQEALKGRNCGSRETENSSLSDPTKTFDTCDSDNGSLIFNVRDLGFSIAPYPTRVIDDSSIRGVLSADEVRAHLNLEPEAEASVKRSIKEKIKSCLVRNQPRLGVKDGTYLPINDLYTILSDESIRALLQEEFPRKQYKDICNNLEVYLRRRRILGILLYMYPTDLRLFQDFVSGNITDQDLPLTPMGSLDEPSFRKQCGREDTTTMMKWGDNDIALFHIYQPIFLAPFFDIQEKRLCNYSLDESIRLPWLDYEFKTRGGNGIVHRVEIHPSHHNFKSRQVRNIS